MKRAISLLLSITMLLSLLAGLDITAFASTKTGKCGDNVTYTYDTSTGKVVISGTGKMFDYSASADDYILPDDVSPFYNDKSIKIVVIDYGITSIGSCTFYGCTNLSQITIPDSVSSIGDGAFYNTAYYNKRSNWSDNCLYINNALIKANSYISGEVVINDSTTLIADSAFDGCEEVTTVTIPNGVTSIGKCAFYGCSGLTNISIPNSIVSIESYAFDLCENLTDVYYGGNKEQKIKCKLI